MFEIWMFMYGKCLLGRRIPLLGQLNEEGLKTLRIRSEFFGFIFFDSVVVLRTTSGSHWDLITVGLAMRKAFISLRRHFRKGG